MFRKQVNYNFAWSRSEASKTYGNKCGKTEGAVQSTLMAK